MPVHSEAKICHFAMYRGPNPLIKSWKREVKKTDEKREAQKTREAGSAIF
jgi:hypothetical protein